MRRYARLLYEPFLALLGFIAVLAYSGHAELPLPSAAGVQNSSAIRCVADCTYRGNDGNCRVMSSTTYCEFSASCVPRCTYRGNDGTCRIYGSDFCGPNARCIPTCELTQPNGSCALYTEDQCSIGYPYS